MTTSLKVLIGEDDYLVSVGLEKNLKHLGHEVVGVAGNGKIAIDMALNLKPDLILMDINMPVMDGLDAIKKNQ